jgi:class 3 adenylate cyclase
MITSNELREKFLAFFREKGHAIIPSASLIPENDPSVLFTTAGMHPLVPYLLGETHPAGTRLAIGIGVNVGDVVLGAIGSDERMDFTVTGDAVNLASRLCSAAKPSQVLVSQSLRDAISGQESVEAEPLEAIRVRGKQEPVPVYELRAREAINAQPLARTLARPA